MTNTVLPSVRRFLGRVLPEPVKRILRRFFPPPPPAQTNEPARLRWSIPRRHISPDDFYHNLPILPALTDEVQAAILSRPAPALEPLRPDVVCFSIIDWEFRYQRPQQIMSQFAAHGHRVFYISPTKFSPAKSSPRVTVREIKQNVYEVILALPHAHDVVE